MDFVIIANAWEAARDNPTGKHQIALQLAQKGHRVLWIEGSGMRKPSAGNASDRSRIQTKLKLAAKGIRNVQNNIWVTAPVILPLPSSSAARIINSIIYTLAGIWARIRLHLHKPTLINFLPTVPATEKLWPWKSVYFCVDRWEKFEMYDTKVMQHVDRQCCLNADIVLTTSHELLELCRRKNEQSILIGHGVNWQRFNTPLTAKQNGSAKQRPADLPDGSIVGFFGLLSEWVDQNLLIKLARSLADQQNGKLQPWF
jgi:glycosyltransferase involved in cell wall biosynthesis